MRLFILLISLILIGCSSQPKVAATPVKQPIKECVDVNKEMLKTLDKINTSIDRLNQAFHLENMARGPALLDRKNGKINWRTYEDIDPTEIQSQNKYLIIYFYADFCKACEMMDERVFKNKKIIELMNEKFIAIKINIEEHPEVFMKYSKDQTVPFTMFVAPNMAVVGMAKGYVSPDKFNKVLLTINKHSK